MMRVLCILSLIIFFSLPCMAYESDLIILPNVFITDTSEAEEEIDPNNITLKGYAEFMEDSQAIYLKDPDDDQLVLNLKIQRKLC